MNREKFERVIQWPSLIFNDADLDQKYQDRRIDVLGLPVLFKVCGGIVVAILILRRIELLILVSLDISTESGGKSEEYLLFGLLLAVIFIELLTAFVRPLFKLRGLVAMLYVFFSISYSAYKYNKTNIPLVIPLYEPDLTGK